MQEISINIADRVVTSILKLLVNAFRFGMYLVNLILIMLSNAIEKYCLEGWTWYQNRIEYLEGVTGEAETIETDTEQFIIQSNEFKTIYNDLRSNIDVTKDVNLILDDTLSKDIVNKVDRLVKIVEAETIVQGYKFASETESKIKEADIYKKYILIKKLEID